MDTLSKATLPILCNLHLSPKKPRGISAGLRFLCTCQYQVECHSWVCLAFSDESAQTHLSPKAHDAFFNVLCLLVLHRYCVRQTVEMTKIFCQKILEMGWGDQKGLSHLSYMSVFHH